MNIILTDSPTMQSALQEVCKEGYVILLPNDVLGLPSDVRLQSVTYFKTLRTPLEVFQEFLNMHMRHINSKTRLSVVIAYEVGQ